eukprot:710191-Rhodomonas_salina.2
MLRPLLSFSLADIPCPTPMLRGSHVRCILFSFVVHELVQEPMDEWPCDAKSLRERPVANPLQPVSSTALQIFIWSGVENQESETQP